MSGWVSTGSVSISIVPLVCKSVQNLIFTLTCQRCVTFWPVYLMIYQFLIHMSSIWIYVISCVCLSVQPSICPSILCSKSFCVGQCVQNFQPNLFIPAMLIGIIGIYLLMLLSVILTLAGGHKVSTKLNLLVSCSSKTCWLHNLWDEIL